MTPTPTTRRWLIAEPDSRAETLARQLRTGRLVAQLLINRGLAEPAAARAFLQPKLSDMHDPAELPGCEAAAERVIAAVRAGQKITLYGDYDVDGMTGLAILYRLLRLLEADVEFYIPHRIDEGYGLNLEAIEAIAAAGTKLVVTVDCGISAVACAARAAELGLTLIVTDHHAPGPDLPPAAEIVHPTVRPGYGNEHLCGAGVALKLAWQIARSDGGAKRVSDALRDFLLDATCLAALGTIADVVPLVGENRAIAAFGLRGLATSSHPGIAALIDAAGVDRRKVGEYDVGFQLGPRLNAAGRMGHAAEAAELLIRPEANDCGAIAASLTQVNNQRRTVEKAIAEQAAERVVSQGLDGPGNRVIVLADESWHAGVIGIVASRLVERFCRPVVLISLANGRGAGSCRSVEGYHIAEGLRACEQHLLGCGGHAMAAGLKIAPEDVPAFSAALTAHAAENVSDEMMTPTLRIDAETTLGELSTPVAKQIQSMAPFGAGNPAPMLAVRGAQLLMAPRRIGSTGRTLSMLLGQGDRRIRCVGFGMGDLADRLVGVRTVAVAGQPQINAFRGRESVELMLRDVRWE